MSIKALLEEHNDLAEKAGKMKLSVWKQSKEKLQGRIVELKKIVGEPEEKPKKVKSAAHKAADKLIEKEAKRVAEAKDQLTIVDIAEECGVNPKVARAKLRRAGKKSNEGRWSTVKRGSSEHKELVQFFKPSKEKE